MIFLEQKELDELEAFLKREKFSPKSNFKEVLWQKLLLYINGQENFPASNQIFFDKMLQKIYGAKVIDLSDEDIAKVAGGTSNNFRHDRES